MQKIDLLEDEKWWGGNIQMGNLMPFSLEEISVSLLGNNAGNQSQPLLISNKGRWIYSEDPFSFHFKNKSIQIEDEITSVFHGQNGNSIKDAYLYINKTYFKPNGKIPNELLFTHPQYNTWIELMYDQNEEDILGYAESIIANGYPPGVLMIDDTWQENYGIWKFSPRRFNNPETMIDKLHQLGFKVMLWVCPFVSADSPQYRYLAKEGLLIMETGNQSDILWANTQNRPAIIRWWNGASAVIDLSHLGGKSWFKEQLDNLIKNYGIDGFKFDAGDAKFYTGNLTSHLNWHANKHMQSFAELGLDYQLNELRACWKLAGRPIVQRLRDKRHNWEDLSELIPGIIAQGLMGYAFTCPDMIGGGEYQSFIKAESIDQELVVRSAQVSALMSMMQFSAAPWRILDAEHQEYCKQAALLHKEMGGEILEIAKASAKSGEPIIRSMEYQYSGKGYDSISDQFFLGEDILVTPVLKKGAIKRLVKFPHGEWKRQDMDGKYQGEQEVEINVPLSNLAWFRRDFK